MGAAILVAASNIMRVGMNWEVGALRADRADEPVVLLLSKFLSEIHSQGSSLRFKQASDVLDAEHMDTLMDKLVNKVQERLLVFDTSDTELNKGTKHLP